MRLYPSFLVCAATVSLCSAAWVEIAGITRDWGSGRPLQGVIVRLAQGDRIDTTDGAGAFNLTGTTGYLGPGGRAGSAVAAAEPVLRPDGRIGLSLAQPARVEVVGATLGGRQLYKEEWMLPAGQHAVMRGSAPRGVVLYRVRVNGTDCMLRCVNMDAGDRALGRQVLSSADAPPRAKSAEAYFDTIVAEKEGYQTKRVATVNRVAMDLSLEMKATDGGTVTDADGNVYKVLLIGTQFWMSENLKTTKYRDGSAIPVVTDSGAWSALAAPGFCWYDNNQTANKKTYGALYNWYAVNTGKLAPAGWHAASDSEWVALANFVGGATGGGGRLKETGTTHWSLQIVTATNDYGFTALPGGCREASGAFSNLSSTGSWWTATANDGATAWFRSMFDMYNSIFRSAKSKRFGYSVRCVRDVNYTPPAPVTWLVATPGAGCVDLAWNTVSGATRYTIYYRAGVTVDTLNGTPIRDVYTPYKVTGLANGTTYAFTVTSSDGTLASPMHKWWTATPR